MICPKCQELELNSKVTYCGSSGTLMASRPFYDEYGFLHFHDSNTDKSVYKCSNDHVYQVTTNRPCKSCDFGHEKAKVEISG